MFAFAGYCHPDSQLNAALSGSSISYSSNTLYYASLSNQQSVSGGITINALYSNGSTQHTIPMMLYSCDRQGLLSQVDFSMIDPVGIADSIGWGFFIGSMVLGVAFAVRQLLSLLK